MMIQKEDGDPADILQMVRWQRELYSSKPQLRKLGALAALDNYYILLEPFSRLQRR
jgi:hypothetical protein